MIVFEVDLKEWLGTEQGEEVEAWFTNATVWSSCRVMAMTWDWGSWLLLCLPMCLVNTIAYDCLWRVTVDIHQSCERSYT